MLDTEKFCNEMVKNLPKKPLSLCDSFELIAILMAGYMELEGMTAVEAFDKVMNFKKDALIEEIEWTFALLDK